MGDVLERAEVEQPIGGLVRTRRQRMELTLQDVADEAGISTGYLSLVERDKAVPTLTTLGKIAGALGVGLDHFVARPQPTDCVTSAATRRQFQVAGSDIRYERLGADFPGRELCSFIMTIGPGYASEPVRHAGEESIFVLSGRLRLTLDGEAMALAAGDSAHYDAGRLHAWANPGDAPVRVLWTGTIDLFGRDG
jgi:transcriptional regulator with XRE-family HTH domain